MFSTGSRQQQEPLVRMQHREDMKVHDWRYTVLYCTVLYCTVLYCTVLKVHDWRYTWAAKYNTTDTMLLVSGVLDEVDGMVAVFQVVSSGDTGVYNVRMNIF